MKPSPLRHVLAVLRLKIELGQKEMAALASCSRATIQAVELGHLKLSESLALRISLETGVEINWLLRNDLTAPIRVSADAGLLINQHTNVLPSKVIYSVETFRLVQAHRKDSSGMSSIWGAMCNGLEVHARLRAIMESARSRHLIELAFYKLEKFMEEMQAEFGFTDKIVDLRDAMDDYDPEALDKALKFVEAELEAVRMFLRVARDDRDPSEISAQEQEELETLLMMTKVASPYEDLTNPKVIERVRAARALEKNATAEIADLINSGQLKIKHPRPTGK